MKFGTYWNKNTSKNSQNKSNFADGWLSLKIYIIKNNDIEKQTKHIVIINVNNAFTVHLNLNQRSKL